LEDPLINGRSESDIRLREAVASDGEAIAAIYNHYVKNTTITFEEVSVSGAEMTARISEVQDAKLPYLVAEAGERTVGFAYASKWKGRCAYRFSVETTVYLAQDNIRRGLGSLLYRELLSRLDEAQLHAAIGGIALPNEASIALHQKLGFVQVAQFREVGFKFGRWIDVGYWERVFETKNTHT
jgi:phosphinothricin acetyltransferase